MKVAVMYDLPSSTMKQSVFTSMIDQYKDLDADIRILCAGMEGRVGDKYDYLRGRGDVFWSNGLPPLMAIGVQERWFPDITLNVPENFPLREFM